MPRPVKPWTGATDATKAPPRVRARIFDRDGGKCHLCGLPIKPGETWNADHVIALINSGANSEANLAPAHSHCHLGKTAQDVAEKAKVAAVRAKHIGAVRPAGNIKSAGFQATAKPEKPVRRPPLAPRNLYEGTTR